MTSREETATTKDQILDAAYEIFMRKGVNGAGIKEIAGRAGVNKAMIYYYFDSKEDLFIEVFRQAVEESGLKTVAILEGRTPLFEKIHLYIDTFIENLLEAPQISGFVMNELNRYPELLTEILLSEMKFDSTKLNEQLGEAADRYEIARIDSRQLLVNIISLCMGPVINSSYYSGILGIDSREEYNDFLKERKGIIYDMTISWLTT